MAYHPQTLNIHLSWHLKVYSKGRKHVIWQQHQLENNQELSHAYPS